MLTTTTLSRMQRLAAAVGRKRAGTQSIRRVSGASLNSSLAAIRPLSMATPSNGRLGCSGRAPRRDWMHDKQTLSLSVAASTSRAKLAEPILMPVR